MGDSSNPFDDEVVAAVLRHMNEDHAEDSVLICRAFGGRPDATSATMTGLDATGGEFRVDGPEGGPATVRVAWSRRITERPQIREEVARLHHEAAELLGGSPAEG